MNLGVTVFASFGRGHINDLAGAAFDHNEAVLAQGRTLHRVCGRSTGIGAFEGVFVLQSNNISQSSLFAKAALKRIVATI